MKVNKNLREGIPRNKKAAFLPESHRWHIALMYNKRSLSGTISRSSKYSTINAIRHLTRNPAEKTRGLALVYYNYRHYNPLDGRWTSMDPVGTRGESDIYSFVSNQPLKDTDLLGLTNDELIVDYILLDGGWDLTSLGTRYTRWASDFVDSASREKEFNPNKFCDTESKCIKKLTIFAHGKVENGRATIYLNYREYTDNMVEDSSFYSDFSKFINSKNIKFCKEAQIILRICSIGKIDSIAKRIEDHYDGVKVTTYAYPIFPSGVRQPFFSLIDWIKSM